MNFNPMRIQIQVEGTVQGVGFRPFVYRLAHRHHLGGWVLNHPAGVEIEVEGKAQEIAQFLAELRQEPPPLARITDLTWREVVPRGEAQFAIQQSGGGCLSTMAVPADMAVCEDCRRELFDPANRRYRYPFINCTNCGPRFTIMRDIPYDRSQTTMASFRMCPACEKEYLNPLDRRFHAQPNACWDCGPRLQLLERNGAPLSAEDPIELAIALLQAGRIVAIKGLGGFHLAVDACQEPAVCRLRERKQREEKPLAVMAYALEGVGRFCQWGEKEVELLTSGPRPIVLLPKRSPDPLAPSVAPGQKVHGVMLPYAPLHYLLLRADPKTSSQGAAAAHPPEEAGASGWGDRGGSNDRPFLALVMTSGNLSHLPLAKDDAEAMTRLGGIADYFLVHNREIFVRADDSVTRVVRGKRQLLRRARGYVPEPIQLPGTGPTVLAVGGELKNTLCLIQGKRAYLSQHIGDLENGETYQVFLETIRHFQEILEAEPEILAYDLHPDYLSTQYALERAGPEKIGVQHHHAHLASCLAEHGWREGKVIGVVFDGTGYGLDGHLWGGEFLVGDDLDFRRAAHFAYLPLPGGAAAIRRPARMAISYLDQAFGKELPWLRLPLLERISTAELEVLLRMIQRGLSSPLTAGCGRLFDAVAALVGLRGEVSFEGQAAMELEMALEGEGDEAYDHSIAEELEGGERVRVVGWQPLIREVVEDLLRGTALGQISLKFHNAIVRSILQVCRRLREEEGLETVVLTGGVFQNAYLLAKTAEKLEAKDFKVLIPREVPPNDGGISLGQAVIARRSLQFRLESSRLL